MSQQILEDINESRTSESDVESLDDDVKESFSHQKGEYIDVTVPCSSSTLYAEEHVDGNVYLFRDSEMNNVVARFPVNCSNKPKKSDVICSVSGFNYRIIWVK